MRRTRYSVCLLVLLLEGAPAVSQPFGAHGAHWSYNFWEWSPPYAQLPVDVTSAYWGTIGSDSCYLISTGIPSMCQVYSSMIVTQRNDSVLLWHPGKNEFVLLYDYNAAVGDTHTLYISDPTFGDSSVTQVVTGTGTVLINGSLKRTYTVQTIQNFMYVTGGSDIIEDIGSTWFLFPQFAVCDPLTSGLRCYSDTIIGTYQNWAYSNCDTILYTGIPAPPEENRVTIGPVPATDHLNLRFSHDISEPPVLEIHDVAGRLLFTENIKYPVNDGNLKLDISSLPPGIMMLTIDTGGRIIPLKFVKARLSE